MANNEVLTDLTPAVIKGVLGYNENNFRCAGGKQKRVVLISSAQDRTLYQTVQWVAACSS